MNHRVFAFVSGAAALLTCLGMQSNSSATPATDVPTNIAPVPAAPTVQRLIKVKNVAPDILAWWIDPEHNEQPIELKDPFKQFQGAAFASKAKGVFALPTGVQSVNPIKPQNAVLVSGTEVGIAELQKTLDFLDVPLRQVEVEVKFIQTDEQNSKILGVNAISNQIGSQAVGLSLGFAHGNWPEKLDTSITAGKSKLLLNQRFTANNNFPTQIKTPKSRRLVVGVKDDKGKFQELNIPTPESLLLMVTPTINNDGSVTLVLGPLEVLQWSDGTSGLQLNGPRESGEAIVNVRDGDTIAMQGGAFSLFTSMYGDRKMPQNTLVLLTPRIIHRAGEDQSRFISLQR